MSRFHSRTYYQSLRIWAWMFSPNDHTKRFWPPGSRSGCKTSTWCMRAANLSISKSSTSASRSVFWRSPEAMPKMTGSTDWFWQADSTGVRRPCCVVMRSIFNNSVCRLARPTWKMCWSHTQVSCHCWLNSLNCSLTPILENHVVVENLRKSGLLLLVALRKQRTLTKTEYSPHSQVASTQRYALIIS